jgi:hypothetical protein
VSSDYSVDQWENWVKSNRYIDSYEIVGSSWLQGEVFKYGAVLLRGLPTYTPQDFDRIVKAFGWSAFPYIGGAAPRTLVYGDVFTTNESPPSQVIPFHHEMAQVAKFPTKVFFFCEVEPAEGGETPIVLSHLIYKYYMHLHVYKSQMKSLVPEFV